MRRYPLEPFLSLTGWTLSQVQDVVACNGSEWRKRKAEGVTELTADRIACAAGLHPHAIWPEMLDHALADVSKACEECGAMFVPPPKVPYKRFCERTCQARNAARRRYHADPDNRAKMQARARQYHHAYRSRARSRVRRLAADS